MKNRKRIFSGKLVGLVGFVILGALSQSCIDDEETDFEKRVRLDHELITEYLESNNIQAERSVNDYYFTKTKENSAGASVRDDDVVSFYYHMSLLNGKKVDSATADKNGPVKIGFNKDRVTLIPSGLYSAISTMKAGEIYRFYIPSYLAYGNYAYKQLIPANSSLIVDVELAKIEDLEIQEKIEEDMILAYIEEQQLEDVESLSSGLFYKTLSAADANAASPKQNNRIDVYYTGKYLDGEVFDKTKSGTPFSYILGVNSTIKGFDEAVKKMKEGEKIIAIMPSHLAYGESSRVIPTQIKDDLVDKELITNSIEPYSPLVFEIELADIK